MAHECVHAGGIRDVTPSALGCEECLKIGSPWVHLRLCRTCGRVGCADRTALLMVDPYKLTFQACGGLIGARWAAGSAGQRCLVPTTLINKVR